MAIRIVIAISSLYLSQDKTKKLWKKNNDYSHVHDFFFSCLVVVGIRKPKKK